MMIREKEQQIRKTKPEPKPNFVWHYPKVND